MFPRVQDRSNLTTSVTTVNTDYSFAVSLGSKLPTDSSTSTVLTSDSQAMLPEKNHEEIAKTPAKLPYYPDEEMFMCTGSRLLAESGNVTRPFRTVEQGGQPNQCFAPFSRGGVRIFQNPIRTKEVSQAGYGPFSTGSNCAFSVPPVTNTVLGPCERKKASAAGEESVTSVSKTWRETKGILKPTNPLQAKFTIGYRGASSLSSTRVSAESSGSTINYRRSLPVPFDPGRVRARAII